MEIQTVVVKVLAMVGNFAPTPQPQILGLECGSEIGERTTLSILRTAIA